MAEIIVEAQRRTATGKNVNRRLRVSGKIPAIMYGPGKESLSLSVDPNVVKDILYSDSGHNTIFTVSVDGKQHANAMVKNYQLDPVKGKLIHADFLQIAMDQVLKLMVKIETVGEAEGVKMTAGIMDVVTREIEVECLPTNIPESIKVDVSPLKINDYIRVKDIVSVANVKILSDPDVVLVTIVPPIKEEVPAEVPVEAAEPEVIKKGKAEEEEEGEKEPGKPAGKEPGKPVGKEPGKPAGKPPKPESK